ncbi:hypothetical protein B0H21DRAFT_707244 [Amylocystis lapponica]|nr:hypothetical protein B0H21DRAFT_707244 [Amylocystis lapponica]
MGTNDKLPIFPESQQLGRHNWQDWKERLIAIFEYRKIYGHIDGSSTRPLDTSPGAEPSAVAAAVARQESWDDDDVAVKTIIRLNIVDFPSSGVVTAGKTAREVWDQLVARRERKDGRLGVTLISILPSFVVGSVSLATSVP